MRIFLAPILNCILFYSYVSLNIKVVGRAGAPSFDFLHYEI